MYEKSKVKVFRRVLVSLLLMLSVGINVYFVSQTFHKPAFQTTAESLVGTYTTAPDPSLVLPNSPCYLTIEHNLTYCIFTQDELLEMGTVEEIGTNQFKFVSQEQKDRQLYITEDAAYLLYDLQKPVTAFVHIVDAPGYMGNWNFGEMRAFSEQHNKQ